MDTLESNLIADSLPYHASSNMFFAGEEQWQQQQHQGDCQPETPSSKVRSPSPG